MVNSSPALISCLACSASVLLGNTEWPQLGAQEWDMKLNVGKIACVVTGWGHGTSYTLHVINVRTTCPPPLLQANALVQRRPTHRSRSLAAVSEARAGSHWPRKVLTERW